jgi:hypothetical protein
MMLGPTRKRYALLAAGAALGLLLGAAAAPAISHAAIEQASRPHAGVAVDPRTHRALPVAPRADSEAFRDIVEFVEGQLNQIAAGVVKHKERIKAGGGRLLIPSWIESLQGILTGKSATFDYDALSDAEKTKLSLWAFELDKVRAAAAEDTKGDARFNAITDALSDAMKGTPQ